MPPLYRLPAKRSYPLPPDGAVDEGRNVAIMAAVKAEYQSDAARVLQAAQADDSLITTLSERAARFGATPQQHISGLINSLPLLYLAATTNLVHVPKGKSADTLLEQNMAELAKCLGKFSALELLKQATYHTDLALDTHFGVQLQQQ